MPTVRGRVVLAVTISLAIHGLFVAAWLNVHEKHAWGMSGESTEVAGPNDREFVMDIREPLPQLPKTAPTERKSVSNPPNPLPVEITQAKGPGATVQPAYSQETPEPRTSSPPGTPLHGKPKGPISIVYVLDRSSSMGVDGMLRRACDSIRTSLSQLTADCRFQIVAYNGGVDRFDSRLLLPTVENRERASRWLDALTAEGSSDHVRGFREALSLHSDAVFLLTDADDLDEKEVRAIRALVHEPVHLTAAVFGGARPKRETPLERMTREMRGSVRYVGR